MSRPAAVPPARYGADGAPARAAGDDVQGITADDVLARIGAELDGLPGVDLEFSLRLRPGRIDAGDRFGCWLGGQGRGAFEPIGRALARLGAPAPVADAQRGAVLPVRQGIAIAFDDDGPEFRLYLHGRDPTTLADRYISWRWRPGGAPRRSRYAFHFLPETPSGLRPLDLVDARLRAGFALLLEDDRLRQGSGFWLREGEDGAIEQVDLVLPWCPPAGTLRGLVALADALRLPSDARSRWRDLPVRHVAARVGAGAPVVTLYASASCDGPWPADVPELRERVRRGGAAFGRKADRLYRWLPPPAPTGGGDAGTAGAAAGADDGAAADAGVDAGVVVRADHADGTGRFYDGSVSTWEAVLGPGLHYHAGLFESPDAEPDDAAMDAALRRAVTTLYPFIPAGGRVYDVGCGWGGPLAMLVRDLRCPALGLTNSRTQYRHVAGLGLPVRWGDAETTLPPGRFDCILLLESLSHIRDKARLLRRLRPFGDRLVLRVNCQDASPPARTFGGTMHVTSSARLRAMIEAAGWRIRHWRDRRREAHPSIAVWHRRLCALPPTGDRHLETLRAWCARVMQAPDAWARNNPLIEAVAD
ncbi:MAG TPA: class I SAM-dependent methyltransferase [Longimicrobiales bacterium]